jgi:hypothetical protein
MLKLPTHSGFHDLFLNHSLVFIIFINLFGQLKDWVKQVLFLVSCPKGQVKKNVNVEAWKHKILSNFEYLHFVWSCFWIWCNDSCHPIMLTIFLKNLSDWKKRNYSDQYIWEKNMNFLVTDNKIIHRLCRERQSHFFLPDTYSLISDFSLTYLC